MQMGWPFQWVLQGLVVLQPRYTLDLGQERAGVNYAFGALPVHPFHYSTLSALGRFLLSLPMDRQQHQCLRIQNFLPGLLVAAVDTAPPPWCHLSTLPLNFLPLDEHVAGQALKLISAGCQIYDQFHFTGCQIFYQLHFEAHLIFGPGSSPQYEFFDLIGH